MQKLEVKDFYKTTEEIHIEMLKDGKISVPPTLYVLKDGKIGICPITGQPEGISPMDCVKPIVEHISPSAFLFCGEAWGAKFSKKDDIKQYKYGDIEKMPKKFESFIAMGKSIDGKTEYKRIYKIVRNKKGKITKLIKQDTKDVETKKLP